MREIDQNAQAMDTESPAKDVTAFGDVSTGP